MPENNIKRIRDITSKYPIKNFDVPNQSDSLKDDVDPYFWGLLEKGEHLIFKDNNIRE